MRQGLVVLVFLVVGAAHSQDSPEARAILEKAAQAAQSGESYRAEFAEAYVIGPQPKIEQTGTVVWQQPVNTRIEIKMGARDLLLIVRNGQQAWMYAPLTKQYKKFSAAEAASSVPGFMLPFGYGFADVQSAKIGPDEDVIVDGVPIRSHVILTESKPEGRYLGAQGLVSSTLWIDPKHYLVLRRRSTWTFQADPLTTPVPASREFALSKLIWNPPLTAAEFNFSPPEGATEVTERPGAGASAKRGPAAPNQATVIADSLPMYREMSETSPVVIVLRKDDVVTVDFSIGGSGGPWCSVTQAIDGGKSGNVRCDSLRREAVAVSQAPASAPVTLSSLPITRASRIPRAPLRVRVYFVPMGSLAGVDLGYLVRYYKEKFGLTVETLAALPLDQNVFDPDRRQYDVEGLMDQLKRGYPALARNNRTVLIGITGEDIYIPSENWRFALGQRNEGRFAIVSSARMDLNHFDSGAPRDPLILHARLTRFLSREIGFLYYGLPFSGNPQSVVRESIMGVDELDELGEDF